MDVNLPNNTSTVSDPFFGEDASPVTKTKSFDFVLWFYRIIKYWYLFIISLAICLGYAYIKNRSWIPNYQTRAVMVLENRGIGVANAVSVGSYVQNVENQQTILKSYDLVVRTVEKLPQMQVYYFIDNKFNEENLFGRTPIQIECQFVAKNAYGTIYTVAPIDSERCKIYIEETDTEKKKNAPVKYSIEVKYGEFVQEPLFYIKINKTDRFTSNFAPFNFRFVTKSELIGRYANRIGTSIKEGSTVLTITKYGTNQAEDIAYLNSLIAEYQKYNLELKNEAAERSISFLTRQLAIIQDSLFVSENVFRDFQNETGIYSVEIGSNPRRDREALTDATVELKNNEDNLMRITAETKAIFASNDDFPDPSIYGINDPAILAKVKEYNDQVALIRRMGEGHPLYKDIQNKINEARLQITTTLKSQLSNIQSEREKLNERAFDIESKISVLPEQQRQYLRYEDQYNLNQKYNVYLTQKIREARLQQASNIPDNYLLETPRSTGGPINGEERQNTYLFYFALGLIIPLAFVVCKEELFNNTIATKEDCERLAGFPVIGAVENVSKKLSKGRAIVKNFPKSSFAESFRNMRIRIEYMVQRESNIVILVTSAEPADGKTFIAANIASIYQLTGKRVVLVDFDLRRPSVAKLLDINSKRGVSNFLIGQVSLNEILITHPEYGFDVIPAGTLPPNPSELIKTKKTKDLIDYLHSKYDYVIIDCSPVGLVSDAYVLAKLVHTTLFVVRRSKTNKSFFKSVIAQIKNDGIYNVGLVFNDVKGREGYYGTSRYYGDKSYYMKRNSYYHDDYFEK